MRSAKLLLLLLLAISILAGCTVQKNKDGKNQSNLPKTKPNAEVSVGFGEEGQILVTFEDIDKMALIDLKTLEQGDIIDVGVNPQDVTFSPNGENYFAVMAGEPPQAPSGVEGEAPAPVSNLNSNAFWTWETAAHRIVGKSSVSVSDEYNMPEGIAVSQASNRLYIANMKTSKLMIRNLGGSQEDVAQVDVGTGPRRVLVTPDDKYIVTINTNLDNPEQNGSISIIHLLSQKETARIEVGPRPWSGVIYPDNSKVYVSVAGTNEIKEITISDGKVVNTLSVGKSPRGLVLSSDAKILYVVSNEEDSVIPFDLATSTPGTAIAVGKGPTEMASDKTVQILLVANRDAKTLSVINTSQVKVVDTITLDGTPSAIAVWTGAPPAKSQRTPGPQGMKQLIKPEGVTNANPGTAKPGETKPTEPKPGESGK